MNWRTKWRVQKLLAQMPLGDQLYYLLQSHFGGLRDYKIDMHLRGALHLMSSLKSAGVELEGLCAVEVGTGWVPVIPLALFVYSVDHTDTRGNGNGDREKRISDPIQTQSITVEPVTAKQLLRVLQRRWWLAFITALIVSVGIYRVSKQPAVYEATASILVATTHNTPVTTEDLGRISDLMTLARERSAQS